MRTLMLCLAAICFVTTSHAESYRLKYSTTVDVLDDGGDVIGKKTLKSGTRFFLAKPSADEPSTPATGSAKASNDTKLSSKMNTRLQPTDISPAMWKSTHPDHAVLRAEIKLDSYYNFSFSTKKKSHWSVYIDALNQDWSGFGESIYGYAPKSLPVGKKVAKLLADGKSHIALVKVQPTRNEDEDDMAIVEDFEIVEKSASE